jgi:hypothetical protein
LSKKCQYRKELSNKEKVIFGMKLKSIAGVKVNRMPVGGMGSSKIDKLKKIWEQRTLGGEIENAVKRTTVQDNL